MPDQELYQLCSTLLAAIAGKHSELIDQTLPVILRRLNPRRHGPGFSSVLWDGTLYAFTAPQSRVVAKLWKAFHLGCPEVKVELLLDTAGSSGRRLDHVFRGSAAWGTLVVEGSTKGTYKLSECVRQNHV